MAERNNYSEVTPEIVRLAEMSREAGVIDTALFTKYDVKRGLRDLNGKGVWQDSRIFPMFVPPRWWMASRFPQRDAFFTGDTR